MSDILSLVETWLPTNSMRWVATITVTSALSSLFLFEFLTRIGLTVKLLSLTEIRLLLMVSILLFGSLTLNTLLISYINNIKLQSYNLNALVIDAISYIYSVNGDAIPPIIFNELKEHYGLANLEFREFNTVLVRMFYDKSIAWEGAPNISVDKPITIITK